MDKQQIYVVDEQNCKYSDNPDILVVCEHNELSPQMTFENLTLTTENTKELNFSEEYYQKEN